MLQLRDVSLSEIPTFDLPTNKIQTEEDVQTWRQTQAYQDLSIFLRRLNESVVGISLPWSTESPSPAILSVVALLDTLDGWIDQIPPLDSPQRFGNLAFRTWGKRLEEQADGLLVRLLPPEYATLVPHIKPYFLTSFGSFVRMDYGTGHEASFALFLLCLTLTRFFVPEVEEERELVFRVFVRYLRLCWRLQDVYRLEPAGSHGVWGLDDSHFLAYIFGSGQLRDQTETAVSAVLYPPLPPTNLYFMSIMRIHEVKQGPFHEHSSQLHSIAVGVPNWGKVNSGLFKMYEAEVLGKRVVVQHIPLGGVLSWSVGTPKSTTIAQSSSMPSNNSIGSSSATLAPWAQGSIGRLNHTSQLARHGASLPSWSTGPSPTMNPRPRALNTHTTSSISPPLSSMSGQGRRTLQEPKV